MLVVPQRPTVCTAPCALDVGAIFGGPSCPQMTHEKSTWGRFPGGPGACPGRREGMHTPARRHPFWRPADVGLVDLGGVQAALYGFKTQHEKPEARPGAGKRRSLRRQSPKKVDVCSSRSPPRVSHGTIRGLVAGLVVQHTLRKQGRALCLRLVRTGTAPTGFPCTRVSHPLGTRPILTDLHTSANIDDPPCGNRK